MSDPRTKQMFVRSLYATHGLTVVQSPTLEQVEEELEQVRAEIEPLVRAEAALLKRRDELYRQEAARGV